MAKKIIWTRKAQNDRKEILQFWIRHNKTKKYSRELNTLFKETARIISIFPKIGKGTSDKKVRVKVVKEYLIFYEIQGSNIFILTIWDTRRNPEKLIVK